MNLIYFCQELSQAIGHTSSLSFIYEICIWNKFKKKKKKNKQKKTQTKAYNISYTEKNLT